MYKRWTLPFQNTDPPLDVGLHPVMTMQCYESASQSKSISTEIWTRYVNVIKSPGSCHHVCSRTKASRLSSWRSREFTHLKGGERLSAEVLPWPAVSFDLWQSNEIKSVLDDGNFYTGVSAVMEQYFTTLCNHLVDSMRRRKVFTWRKLTYKLTLPHMLFISLNQWILHLIQFAK